MDVATLTVIFKGIGMLLAILGGILFGRYGFRLYKDGAGMGRDFAAFELGPVKLKARSVGSIVMATAFLWAYVGVLLSPNMEKKGDEIRVYSFNTPDVQVKVESIPTKLGISDSLKIKDNPEKLKDLFENTLATDSHKTLLEINGQPANYVPNSVRITKSDSGKYIFETTARSKSTYVNVSFEPRFAEGKIVFAPATVKEVGSFTQEPNKPTK